MFRYCNISQYTNYVVWIDTSDEWYRLWSQCCFAVLRSVRRRIQCETNPTPDESSADRQTDRQTAMYNNSMPFKVDAAFVLMSGLVSLLVAFNFRRDVTTEKLSSIAIDPQGSDVIRWAVWVMTATGTSSLVLPLLRRRQKAISFNKVCSVKKIQ
ncbi:hypothetical protein LSAT2_006961 [Lamellibrachia satsuma]|nr:hypothetical protein LSAT2_006961 [Lamellibrachia satsuma]